MSTPNRLPDRTQTNVGKRYGPPQDTSTAPDNNFAGTTYVTGCSGNTATNPGQPGFRYVLNDGTVLNSNNLTVTESDGTVKQYYVVGDETTTDFYYKNDGLTAGKYNALSQSQKNLYCSSPVGGSGGAVTGVKITDPGERLYAANNPTVNTGSGGAKINVTVNSQGQVIGTSIVRGGSGYKVGDRFSVNQGKASFAYPVSGTLEVTSATATSGGKYYLSNPTSSGKRVREVSRQLNVRIWDPVTDDNNNATDCQPAGTVVETKTVTGFVRTGTTTELMQPPNVIGNGPYADASDFSQVAVHAGLAQEGETVKLRLRSYSQDKFAGWVGETRNGVVSIGTSTAYCAYNVERIFDTVQESDDTGCDAFANLIDKELIIDGNGSTTLGIPTAVSVINPELKPGQGIASGANSPAFNENGDWNWYESCPVQAAGLSSGWDKDYTCGFGTFFVDGPSKGSGELKGSITWGTTIQVYQDPAFDWEETGCKYPFTNIYGSQYYKNIRWRVKDVELRPNYAAWDPKPGHAIGDIWEFRSLECIDRDVKAGTRAVCTNGPLQSPSDSSCPDNPPYDVVARFRVDAIDAQSTITEAKLEYRVETNVKIEYPGTNGAGLTNSNNVFLFSWSDSNDQILNTSAQVVQNKFETDLKRYPRDTEFVKYVRLVHANGGQMSSTISTQIRNDFNLEYQYLENGGEAPKLLSCNGQNQTNSPSPSPTPSPSPSPTGADTQCKYSRDEFYRGTNGTSNGQVDLYEIWNWLGSPKNNPNPICPRPENDSGLVQDNEPDMTDFAGLEIQRWKNCDGSLIGSIQEETVPCDGDLDLTYFIDTRIAPWWGDQELAPPSLNMTKPNDVIYMVNVPPTQTETFFFKAQPTGTSANKRFQEVKANITFPSITGTPRPGEPAIQARNTVRVTWYARTTANPNLQVLGGFDTAAGGSISSNVTNLLITASGNPYSNGTSGTLTTTMTVPEARDGECSDTEADNLDFPLRGTEFFCKVEVDNRPFNPKSTGGAFMPGFGGQVSNANRYLNDASKFFKNEINCTDATISCGGNSVKEVKTSEPTTITFSMNINTNCLQYRSGTAKISIRRFWPCPTFSPTPKEANQWIVQKQTVAIPQTTASSATISYNLTVNTDKTDYMPGEDGVDVAPGDCHWVYYAYWEIDYPGVDCRAGAWSNPGCNTGEGKSQLDQIYCIQDQQCGANSPSGPSGSCDGSGWEPGEFDFATCLPYCWTYEIYQCALSYYWCYIQPEPGVNCSGTGSAPSPSPSDSAGESPYGPGCECPICEQSIMVRVLEGTECGILGIPFQEEGVKIGPNTGAVDFFNQKTASFDNGITNYTSNPKIIGSADDYLYPCDPDLTPGSTPDQQCLSMGKATWVFLPRKTFDTLTTLGNDAAIRIVDYDTAEVDCDETVFTQATYYYEKVFKNGTTSGIQPLPAYLGGPEYDGYLRKYNPGAGTNTEAMPYWREVGNSSEKGTGGFFDIVWDPETTVSMTIYVNVTSTNDYFGNAQYHPPPAGFIESDFDTVTCVQSPRGAAGGTPIVGICRDLIPIANFGIADKQNVPEFKEPTGITCPSGEVPYQNLSEINLNQCCCAGSSGCFDWYSQCYDFDEEANCPAETLQEVVVCATSGAPPATPSPTPTPGPSTPSPTPSPGPAIPPNPGPFNPPGIPSIER